MKTTYQFNSTQRFNIIPAQRYGVPILSKGKQILRIEDSKTNKVLKPWYTDLSPALAQCSALNGNDKRKPFHAPVYAVCPFSDKGYGFPVSSEKIAEFNDSESISTTTERMISVIESIEPAPTKKRSASPRKKAVATTKPVAKKASAAKKKVVSKKKETVSV